MSSLNLFFVLFLFTFSFSFFNVKCTFLNLSPYNYPKRQGNLKDARYQVALLGTNDLNGYLFPEYYTNPLTGKKYTGRGLKNLWGYISNIRRGWGSRLVWLDAGNQFEGTLESKVSFGESMNNFFNFAGLNGANIGKNDWNYGEDFLKHYTKRNNFPVTLTNVYDNNLESNIFLPNQFNITVLSAGKIKIGIIGISSFINEYDQKLNNLEFKQYADAIIPAAASLRNVYGVNIVVLLSDPSMKCQEYPADNEELKLNIMSNSNNICQYEGELFNLLSLLPEKTVDVVISTSGESDSLNHHFFNGIPIISANKNGKNFNVIYLSFDKNTLEYIPSQTIIEGPIPVCHKVFANTKNCEELTSIEEANKAGELQNFLFHGRPLDFDPRIDTLFFPYIGMTAKYESEILTKLSETLKMEPSKETVLGNLISDYLINATEADIAIVDPAIAKGEWLVGNLNISNVLKMFPETKTFIVTFEMKGHEIKRMIKELTLHKGNIYPTSGLIQYIKSGKVKDVKLNDESEINDDQVYVIASTDNSVPKFENGFSEINQWYQPRNLHYIENFVFGIIDYLKSFGEDGFDKSEFYDTKLLRVREA